MGDITSQQQCQHPIPGLTPALNCPNHSASPTLRAFQNRSGQVFQAASHRGLASSLTVALYTQSKGANGEGVFAGSSPARPQLRVSGLGGGGN